MDISSIFAHLFVYRAPESPDKIEEEKMEVEKLDSEIVDLEDDGMTLEKESGARSEIKMDVEDEVEVKLEKTSTSVSEQLPSTSTEIKKEEEDEKGEEDEFDEYNDGDILLGKRSKLKSDLDALQKYLPQVQVKTLETPEDSGCTHVVATPNNTFYIPLHPIDKPVKTYPFKLDLFQERAVQCVDNYQSVLVSAHTSAGKTVVAE